MTDDPLKDLKPREKELVERYPIDRWRVPMIVDVTVDGVPQTRYACRICAALDGFHPEHNPERLMETPTDVENHIRSEHTNGAAEA